MYRVSPFIEGLLGQAALPLNLSVNPPKGLTYGNYMSPFVEFASGYLTNPEAAGGCQYCPAKTADQFVHSRFNIKYSDHWRNLGIVFGFVAFNIVAVFWFIYFMRIRTSLLSGRT
ncbi:hypothetical protein EV702DRAFT_1202115 [Suillus placidus]|uniref:CDR ABC transporter domain-containing protein n=1 Tax=Suillus placidus TaxID=48579 RepID=A0A9P6ZM64_9AGAM|nr:hypothetical protein EV702DRAFT_1202115 [Suillus placidus]